MVEMLVGQDVFLSAGAHIGTKTKVGSMRRYIYKARDDGLNVLDLKKMNEKIATAVSFLSSFDPQGVYVIGSKDNATNPIKKFCDVTGFQPLYGRFTPGRFTNPSRSDFVEPKLILVVDPAVDKQAVKEAFEINVPCIALCDTNNNTKNIELVVPINNKGRKSIAFVFWLIARELLKKGGKVSSNDDFKPTPADFE